MHLLEYRTTLARGYLAPMKKWFSEQSRRSFESSVAVPVVLLSDGPKCQTTALVS